MVNPGQFWELDQDVMELHGFQLSPSDWLVLKVCVHHVIHTDNNELMEVDYPQRDLFLMPSSVIESDDTAAAYSYFYGNVSPMGVTVDGRMCEELVSLSRVLNLNRTGIAHNALPVVILLVTSTIEDMEEVDDVDSDMEITQSFRIDEDFLDPDAFQWSFSHDHSLPLIASAHHYTYHNDSVELENPTEITVTQLLAVPFCVLESDDDEPARLFFSTALAHMGVIVDGPLLDQLLDHCRHMNEVRTFNRYTNNTIPTVFLDVEVRRWPSNYYIYGSTDDDAITRAMEESMEEAKQMVPASPSSLDTLEKVKFDGSCCMNHQCLVCLEAFLVDEVITCMPCSHLYHEDCIIKWLKTSHVCPLCRFQMPIN